MAVVINKEPGENQTAAMRRISWAAILAGIIIVLVLQLSLSLFGIGIGASTIDPLHQGETPTASTFSIGATIWWIVASMIALMAGGWVAGRLAGIPTQTDGLLHGLITWGAATLVTVYFLTSAAGSLIGGAFGIMGSALSATGQGMAGLAPEVSDFVKSQVPQTDVTWKDIQQEAKLLLQQTGKQQLQPDSLKNTAKQTTENVKESAQQSASNPQQTEEPLLTALDQMIRKGKNVASEADKKAVANILVARTDMSQQEAEKAVQGWADTYQKTMTQYEELKGQAQQQARETADATAKAVSQASIWTFITLMFGASAAMTGGVLGAPRYPLRATSAGV